MTSTIPPAKAKKTDPLIDSVVNGKYRIQALVAAGGMGKIYRAEQIALSRSVALKVLHTPVDSEGEETQFKKRFLREASILARLQHPNIVTIFDYGAIEGSETERYFISMEYLSGETLGRRIADRVSLATKDTIRIARQIARGLTEAHAHGVIHRDLKPSNVMLLAGRDGEEMIKIVDFGIVKIVGDDSQEEDLTQEGSFIGSPKYMAPEQITRGGKIDARTDIYSFGIILYQCITGSVPFDGSSSIQTLMAHLNHVPQPIRERAPSADVPDWLDDLVMSCIAKDPEQRPQSMDAVARTLAEAEAALTSNRLLAAISVRNSSPTLTATNDRVSITGTGSGVAASTGTGSITGTLQSPRSPSGITTQGTISSVHPGPQESEKTRTSPGIKKGEAEKRSPFPFMVGAAVLVLLGLGGMLLLRQGAPPPPVQAAPVVIPPPLPPLTTHFAMRIESIPPGAEVHEGDRVLGNTPLELSVDDDAVRRAPRSFTLVKDGFTSYPITQGPSDDSVRIVAPLVAIPVAAAPSAAASTTAPTRAPGAPSRRGRGDPGAAAAAPSPSHPDLDIRMNR